MTLKVFRTPIGFHDAYVAVPSQKAALEAWGASANLFARGAAEVVTDPALTAEPLARPGVVVKRLRGTEAEQIAALPPDRQPHPPPRQRNAGSRTKPGPAPPRPSRTPLDAAEQALVEALAAQAEEDTALAARRALLDEEERAARTRHEDERRRLERRRDEERARYDKAIERWRG